MAIWAIADLHLSFSTPNKDMSIFGEHWYDHYKKIECSWKKHVSDQDLVLIPGDISWAMKIEDALEDFKWIDALPGKKVIVRGNHDYWWSSASKVRKALPQSISIIHNDHFEWHNISIAGAKLWESPDYNFDKYIILNPGTALPTPKDPEQQKKLFQRELLRLEKSLQSIPNDSPYRIVMTHYPPIDAELHNSAVSSMLENYKIDLCIFGHLHSLNKNASIFGKKNGIEYKLVAADYIDFNLSRLL